MSCVLARPGIDVQIYIYIISLFNVQVVIFSVAVKHLTIERNTSQSASQFESVTEKGRRVYLQYICLHIQFKGQRIEIGINKMIFLQNAKTQRDIFSQIKFRQVEIKIRKCNIKKQSEQIKELLFFRFSFSAKWNQCNPPSFYHHVRIRSLCLGAQSQCTELTYLFVVN